ncbi:MAG: ABC transporter ATP-binding protein [Rhodospirillales bacterium]
MLQIEGLHLAYGKVAAVKGVDLAVEEGQLVCLIGANGAGKSTILRGISGLLTPAVGDIRFAGRSIARLPAHRITRLGIVQVPEGRQVFNQMTVAENLMIGGYGVRDRRERRRRIDAVVAQFPRLGERLTQPAGLLSGGEQQMLAMGRALVAEPRLLLLDEPSMGLAPLMIEEVFELIRRLKAEGRTILLVEQNARLAFDVADHAYVLESGRIRLSGPAVAVADDPLVLHAYLGV